MRTRLLAVCLAASLSLLAACGDDDDPAAQSPYASIVQELKASGVGQFLDTTPSSSATNGPWQEYFYDPAKEGPICLHGGQFQVNIRHGSSKKVLLYLQGGGACWDFGTCWQIPIANFMAGPGVSAGILNPNDPRNPFADWNVVYVPYCDGSVFAGNNVPVYDGRRTFHHGLQNLDAAVGMMRHEFPNAEEIVVSGSSAGGFGTYTGYGATRIAFPNTPILILDDCGPGIQNPNDVAPYTARVENWHYRDVVPASCTQCTTQLTYLTPWALDRDPTLRVAYFDYLQDPVLEFFLNLDDAGFSGLLKSVTGGIQPHYATRFKRFFAQGKVHTVLLSPAFNTLKINDITVHDWTADFLTNGAKWQDLVQP